MEYAMWKGKRIAASDFADYEEEKKLRIASRKREIKCCDADCSSKFVKYCHGDVKEPYFAHCENINCDYARYESEMPKEIHDLKMALYNHFKKKGCNVEIETKVLKKHYSHILITLPNEKRIAIEFLTTKVTPSLTDCLTKEYEELGVEVQWIVVSDNVKVWDEHKNSFAKRHSLNETKNNTLFIVHPKTKEIFQYKLDSQQYVYGEESIDLIHFGYPDIYEKIGKIENLILDRGTLTLSDFGRCYMQWVGEKQGIFSKIVAERENNKKEKDKEKAQQLINENKKNKRAEYSRSAYSDKIYAYLNNNCTDTSPTEDKGRKEMRVSMEDNLKGEKIIYTCGFAPKFGEVINQAKDEKGKIYIEIKFDDGSCEAKSLEELIKNNQIFYNR